MVALFGKVLLASTIRPPSPSSLVAFPAPKLLAASAVFINLLGVSATNPPVSPSNVLSLKNVIATKTFPIGVTN